MAILSPKYSRMWSRGWYLNQQPQRAQYWWSTCRRFSTGAVDPSWNQKSAGQRIWPLFVTLREENHHLWKIKLAIMKREGSRKAIFLQKPTNTDLGKIRHIVWKNSTDRKLNTSDSTIVRNLLYFVIYTKMAWKAILVEASYPWRLVWCLNITYIK